MHQILALSSFQLAYLHPDRRQTYTAVGIHHQDAALRGMRKILQNINEDNAPAAFATSTLITLSVFASRGQDALDPDIESQNVLDDLADIFALVQGIGRVIAAAQMGLVMRGPFTHLFREPPWETAPQPLFQKLLQRLPTLVSLFESEESVDEDMRRELLAFVGGMRENLLRCSKPCVENRDIRFLFYWPLHLSPNFMFWLRQRTPGVMVIILHYTTVLAHAEHRFWFLSGWTERVVQAVKEEAIEEPWAGAMDWAFECIKVQRATPVSPPSTLPVENLAI